MILIAARPGMGKTALAVNNISVNAARAGYPVHVFSFEMSSDEITYRMLAAETGKHPGHNALSSYLAISHQSKIKQAVAQKLQEKGLGDGPLADSKKFGGSTRVLADRLKAKRSSDSGDKGLPVEPAGSGELISTV